MSDQQEGLTTSAEIRAVRHKTWDECGIEEKVDRLRRELLAQRYQVRAALEATEGLREHEHSATGIMVPLHRRHGQGMVAGERDPLA